MTGASDAVRARPLTPSAQRGTAPVYQKAYYI